MSHLTAMNHINTNISIGMDDLVNVFVSRYENDRYDARDQIQSELRKLIAQQKEVFNTITERVKSTYKSIDPIDNILSKITYKLKDDSIRICEKQHNITFCFEIRTRLKDGIQRSYTPMMESTTVECLVTTMTDVEITQLTELEKLMQEQRTLLLKVNDELKSIDRKVRMLKGKLAEQKLTDAGMTDLLNNPELLKIME